MDTLYLSLLITLITGISLYLASLSLILCFIDYLIYSYHEYLPRVLCYLIPLYSDSYSEEDTCSQGKMTHTLTRVVHLDRIESD